MAQVKFYTKILLLEHGFCYVNIDYSLFLLSEVAMGIKECVCDTQTKLIHV